MEDKEKLKRIEAICKEAFSTGDNNKAKAIMHKAQALCNIYALFLYDGTVLQQIEEKNQISIDEILEKQEAKYAN